MTREPDQRIDASNSPDSDRLDSWKEIAAFLQRDVRTVQRWENLAGLPVHRHAESRLRTAYAYKSELDQWWRIQRAVDVGDSGSEGGGPSELEPESRRLLRTRPFVRVAGLCVLAGAVATAAFFYTANTPGTSTGIRTPIPVLLTRFEDQIGRPQVAAAVEEAVARYMSRGGPVEPVAPARVARALRLMRREPGTLLTDAIGREVAARDGRIAYVLAGRVHRLDSRYFVDIRAIEPADSRVRVSLEWEGASFDEVLARSEQGARRLVELLTGAAASDRKPAELLEPVTSSSTSAVRLYTAALQAGSRWQWGASELLARRAAAADDRLAAAHAWTGWAMRQQGRPVRESLALLERAVALATDVTEREAYLVSGMAKSVAGDLAGAGSAFEAVLRLHPKDRQALDLLIDVSWRTGRTGKAVDLSVTRAESYPDDFYANVRAAHALTMGKRHASRAADFAARARQVASPQNLSERPAWHAWLELLPVFHQWMAGENQVAFEALARLEGSLPDRLGRERDAFATAVGFANLAFGRTGQAERSLRFGSSPELQVNLALVSLSQGDEAAARGWLEQVRDHSALRPALFARVGLDQEAERGLEAALPSEHGEGIAEVTRGLLAARRRQSINANAALRRGAQLLRSTGQAEFFLAIEALVQLARARGALHPATRLLFEAASERAHTYGVGHWSGGYWTHLNGELIAVLREQGRHDEAERVASRLRQLLRNADRHPPALAIARTPDVP